jgi:hypothetical protein
LWFSPTRRKFDSCTEYIFFYFWFVPQCIFNEKRKHKTAAPTMIGVVLCFLVCTLLCFTCGAYVPPPEHPAAEESECLNRVDPNDHCTTAQWYAQTETCEVTIDSDCVLQRNGEAKCAEMVTALGDWCLVLVRFDRENSKCITEQRSVCKTAHWFAKSVSQLFGTKRTHDVVIVDDVVSK